jgi:hypothetical protein
MSAPPTPYPLTRFLATLLSYKPHQLVTADATKAAAHFGISEAHAAGYIRQQRELRITA